jgi:hypothetical protein
MSLNIKLNKSVKILFVFVSLGLSISGCSTIEPTNFKNISYSAKLPEQHQKITTVEIKRKGRFTIVKKVLPFLKEKVAELNLDRPVVISNVMIKPLNETRKEVDTFKSCTKSDPVESANSHRSANPYFTSTPSRCIKRHKMITKQSNYLRITADVFELPETIRL